MKTKISTVWTIILISGFAFFISCNRNPNLPDDAVRIWTLDDPQGLNPYNTNDATASLIKEKIFQKLLSIDHDTYELVPVLARQRPVIEVLGDSAMRMTFELRPEARWDNGEPITAKDVVFSFKVLMCPHVNDQPLKPYLEFVESFTLYEDNPLKFTINCNKVYMRAEYSAGYEVWILPKYVYDPWGLLDSFSYQAIRNDESLAENAKVLAFADSFNSEKFNRETEGIIGSGPYRFAGWETGQRIRLERKSSWWGDRVSEEGNEYFEAVPKKITYEIINDQTAAITALKGQQIDVMRSIKAKAYKNDVKGSKKVNRNYNLYEAPFFAFSYLGLNLHNPKLKDRKTRKALAYLVDYDRMMRDVVSGYGERVVGPVHPLLEEFYNDTIRLYDFNPEKARVLLREAGWEDTDGDNVLDKEIDGERTPFTLTFLYNTGNSEREKIGLILQEAFNQAGIDLRLQNYDWSILLEKLRNHEFEIYYGVWGGEPAPEDYKQIYYTTSANGGSNYTFFGNAETDALIDRINATVDESQRADLVKQFQVILHNEVSYIFLWAPMNRIAIHKRFENTHISGFRPGYWVPGFTMAREPVQE